MGFILALNEAIKGKPLSVNCEISEMTQRMLNMLNSLSELIDDIKPIEQPQRFGNQAFRTWYNILKEVMSWIFTLIFHIFNELFVSESHAFDSNSIT